MKQRLESLARQAWAQRRNVLCGFERFPVAVAALALFVAVVNLEIAEIAFLGTSALARLGAATIAAAAIATAVMLFAEAHGRRGVPAQLLSFAAALIFWAAIWYWSALGAAPPALLAVAALCVPLAPYVRRRSGFWGFLWVLAHATALAFVAIAIFCAGVSAILASLDYLFGVEIKSSVYGHVWSTGLGFVGPLFVLSQIPLRFPREDAADPADFIVSGVRVLSDFVAVPLLAVYAAILHAYALKIVLAGEMPRGQIGWMVLSFGLAVLSLRIIVDPFGPFSRPTTRLFLRWWAPALAVPLVLLVIAVWQRIDAYGLTPERYGLALFGVFLGGVLAAQTLPRWRNDIRLVPALGASLLLVTGVGPWGMVSLPARQQAENLTAILASAGALDDGRVIASPKLSPPDARRVVSIVSMLKVVEQLDRLRPLFLGQPDDPFAVGANEQVRAVTKRLGADPVPRRAIIEDGSFAISVGAASAVAFEGYDLLLPALTWRNDQPPLEVAWGTRTFWIGTAAGGLRIQSGARNVLVPSEALRPALAALGEADARRGEAAMPLVEVTQEGARIGLLFQRAVGRVGKYVAIGGGDFLLLLRAEDWE